MFANISPPSDSAQVDPHMPLNLAGVMTSDDMKSWTSSRVSKEHDSDKLFFERFLGILHFGVLMIFLQFHFACKSRIVSI